MPLSEKAEMAQQMGAAEEFSDCLIRSALIRQSSDRDGDIYISARKSMTIRFYAHSIAKRAEGTALIDLGATENFMNLTYTKWL